jgi:protein phosphatase
MKAYSATHKGLVREDNEDRAIVRQFGNGAVLLAVADGMGGRAAGERAAQIVADSLDAFDPDTESVEGHLGQLIQAAKQRIAEESDQHPAHRGMGTTLTAAFIRSGAVHWIHIGDSRLYLFREGVLVRVTEDHTIPGLLLREGEIDEEAARVHPLRNILLNCIGCGDFNADTGMFELKEGDLLVLSTDGLHGMAPEEEIASLLRSTIDLKDKLDALILAALNAGGRDNVTVVALEALNRGPERG